MLSNIYQKHEFLISYLNSIQTTFQLIRNNIFYVYVSWNIRKNKSKQLPNWLPLFFFLPYLNVNHNKAIDKYIGLYYRLLNILKLPHFFLLSKKYQVNISELNVINFSLSGRNWIQLPSKSFFTIIILETVEVISLFGFLVFIK